MLPFRCSLRWLMRAVRTAICTSEEPVSRSWTRYFATISGLGVGRGKSSPYFSSFCTLLLNPGTIAKTRQASGQPRLGDEVRAYGVCKQQRVVVRANSV